MATGWLVENDVVVTAGHCAFDHSHGLGRLVKVKAYVGYEGKARLGSEDPDISQTVESRWGTAVVTTKGWMESEQRQSSDISVIKLEEPFKHVDKAVLFKGRTTPVGGGNVNLGVVGYPGDIIDDQERGAKMYEMFATTNYDLTGAYKNMLQYKIDTNGGKGVLLSSDWKSVQG